MERIVQELIHKPTLALKWIMKPTVKCKDVFRLTWSREPGRVDAKLGVWSAPLSCRVVDAFGAGFALDAKLSDDWVTVSTWAIGLTAVSTETDMKIQKVSLEVHFLVKGYLHPIYRARGHKKPFPGLFEL